MPIKPKIKYTEISLPNSYIKFVNAVADISLANNISYPDQNLKFQDIFNQTIDFFREYGINCTKTLISNNTEILEFLTFSINTEGDVTFELYKVLNNKLIPFFNTDFYGKINANQFLAIIEWIKNHLKDCLEIQTWLNYRKRI